MTKDEIIRMAREAGFDDDSQFTIYNIERFADLVAAHEREACAKVCDELQNDAVAKYFDANAGECAAAIRARGDA